MPMVASIVERNEGRRSSQKGNRVVHTRNFRVRIFPADIPFGTAVALAAEDAAGNRIPGPGDTFAGVAFTGKDADPVANSNVHFDVTVSYEGVGDIEADDVYPTDRPPEISYGSDSVVEPYFMDESDPPKPVVNTAAEPFEQESPREQGRLVITAVVNLDFWNPAEMEAIGNTCNLEAFVIDGTLFPSDTLRLLPPTATRQTETLRIGGVAQTVTYYRATFVFKAKGEGWEDVVLDVGFNELVTSTEYVNGNPTLVKRHQPIYDRAAGPVRRPWPLDGQGRKRLSADEKPAELRFRPYPLRSWSSSLPLL